MMKKIVFIIPLLAGCTAERLSEVGATPKVSQILNPTMVNGYAPISMPMPLPTEIQHGKNSLWQTGSKGFFKDQRARRVGDLITVDVNIDNKESTSIAPSISKSSSTSSSIGNFLGYQKQLANVLPKSFSAAAGSKNQWLSGTSNPTHSGTGKYDIQDKVQFQVAATVIQILPNGNMVVTGRTEIKMLNEVREIELKGIVRSSDIQSNNRITSEKIAELRIVYTGHGDISDVAQRPWGNQLVDKVMPF